MSSDSNIILWIPQSLINIFTYLYSPESCTLCTEPLQYKTLTTMLDMVIYFMNRHHGSSFSHLTYILWQKHEERKTRLHPLKCEAFWRETNPHTGSNRA